MSTSLVFVAPIFNRESCPLWPALSLHQIIGVSPAEEKSGDVREIFQLMHKAESVRKACFLGITNVCGKQNRFVHKHDEDAQYAQLKEFHNGAC